MTPDGQAIVDAINQQTATVTGSVYGYITEASQVMIQNQQTSLAVWLSLALGCLVGYLMARGIVDPWRK
jgi:hypothetical protein